MAPISRCGFRVPCLLLILILANGSPATGSERPSPTAAPPPARPGPVLSGTGAIAGTVRSAEGGSPLESVTVYLYNADRSFAGYTTTGPAGTYTATGLGAGSYTVLAYGGFAGYLNQWYDRVACEMERCFATATRALATPVTVADGATTGGIDFSLSSGGTIRGRVRDASTGAPLPLVDLYVYDSGGGEVYQVTSDATGAFSSQGLATGPHFLRTDNVSGYIDELYDNLACAGRIWAEAGCLSTSGTPIPVTAGSVTQGIEIGLARGGLISGRLTDASTGAAVPDSGVYVYTADGLFVTDAPADGAGHFVTPNGLPSGLYYVGTVNSAGYVDELYDDLPCPGTSCPRTGGTPVTVTRGATTASIDFALTRGGRVAGTVTDAATGSPLRSVWVDVYGESGVALANALTSSSGQYLTGTGLPAGSFRVKTSNGLGYVDRLYADITCPGNRSDPSQFGCALSSGTPVAVSVPNTTTGINFALGLGGRIAGTITRSDTGEPLLSSRVDVFGGTGTPMGVGLAGAGGYRTDALLPGNHYVRTRNQSGYADELYDDLPCPGGACSVTSGTAVAVAAGAITSGIDFTLDPGPALTMTVQRLGAGQGRVLSSPAGVDCGSDCGGEFGEGTLVNLWASPAVGSTFEGWGGACSGTWARCRVTMDAAKTVTAQFGASTATYTVTVTPTGAGSGTVTSSPAGIDCPGTCTGSFGDGTVVTLTATPGAGSAFSGWSGVCAGNGECVLRMDADKQATAAFVTALLLTVSRQGSGSGTVTSSPSGIDCGSDCSEAYLVGTTITLTAAPSPDSLFGGWSDACTGSSSTCTLTMSAARSVTATFQLKGGFYPVTPCRLVDTRSAPGGPLPLGANTETRFVLVGGACGIPATATAVALNVTAVEATTAGHLRVYPAGAARPNISTVNYTPGLTRANNAIAPLGTDGSVAVYVNQATGTVHAVIDVSGYFW